MAPALPFHLSHYFFAYFIFSLPLYAVGKLPSDRTRDPFPFFWEKKSKGTGIHYGLELDSFSTVNCKFTIRLPHITFFCRLLIHKCGLIQWSRGVYTSESFLVCLLQCFDFFLLFHGNNTIQLPTHQYILLIKYCWPNLLFFA